MLYTSKRILKLQTNIYIYYVTMTYYVEEVCIIVMAKTPIFTECEIMNYFFVTHSISLIVLLRFPVKFSETYSLIKLI